jgi:type II secretory pathway predicted ATPase ExeA/outer membrane protein OmpA-like peptidoglycan-associated protein
MYESFFKLRAKPFSLLPDPAFLYFSPAHREALTILEYGLLNEAGFTVLTGDIGVGKTTLLRCLLDRLDESFTVGLIANTHRSVDDLMEWVCSSFDIKAGSRADVGLYEAFIDFVIDQYAKGKRTLLIVDEAQNLCGEALEQLRLLSNINSGNDLVLQLILLGQPQLRDLLRRPELQQFVQRVAASYHLRTLDAEETERYILHRLAVVGGREAIFTSDACDAVFGYSKGVPRVINLLCDAALVYAYAAGSSSVTAEVVDEFVEAQGDHLLIPLERSTEPRRARARPAAAASDGLPSDDQPPDDDWHGEQARESAADAGTEEAALTLVGGVAAAPALDPVAGAGGRVRRAGGEDAGDSNAAGGSPASPRDLEPSDGRGESTGLHAAAVLRPARFRESRASARDEHGDAGELARYGNRATVEVRSAATVAMPPASVAQVPDQAADDGGRVDSPLDSGQTAPTAALPQAATGSHQAPSDDARGAGSFWLGGLAAAIVMAGVLGLGWLWLGTPAGSSALRSLINDVPQPDAVESSGPESGRAETTVSSDTPAVARVVEQGQREAAERASGAADGLGSMSPLAKAQPPNLETSASAADAASRLIGVQQTGTNPGGTKSASSVSTMVLATSSATELPEAEPNAFAAKPGRSSDTSALTPVAVAPGSAFVDASPRLGRQASQAESTASDSTVNAQSNPEQPQQAPERAAEVSPKADNISVTAPVAAQVEQPEQTGFAMQALEAELREAAVSVERKGPNRLVVDLGERVQFGDGSVALDADGAAFLASLVGSLRSTPTRVHVVGHTDHRGPGDVNQRLSERRADTVAQFLRLNGMPAEHLSHEGKGETEPKVALEQEWRLGPAVNRRIELELVQPNGD